MEWTNELIFEFLNLYQNEPTLWNSSAPDHKNKTDAYDAWNRIKTQLKDGIISIKDLKKKRDNLMSTYRRQRTKVRESMGTGSGADDVYKPEWPFYDIMATFLDVIYKPKKTKSSEDPLYSEEIEEEHDNDTTATTVQPAPMEQPATTTKPATFKTPKTSEKNKSKKSRLNECDELKKRSEEAYNIMKQMSQTESDTSLLYCNLLCNKLRDLRESTRDIAMMEIDKIMFTLKQRDNHARNFPNSAYQNISLPISQHLYNSQPSPQYQGALKSPGYSHSSNSQPSPGYSHSSNSQPSPDYSHSSNSQPSPDYSHSSNSQPSPDYSHSSNSQPSPGYSHSYNLQPAPGNAHSSNSQPSSQDQVSLPSPGYTHSYNSQPSPGYSHSSNSQPSPDYSHSSNSQPSPGYSHSSNSQPSPDYSHSSNSQPCPGYSHSYNLQPAPGNAHSSNSQPSSQDQVSLPSPGYTHSTNSQSSPQHQVPLQTPGEVHSSNLQPSPGYPQSSNSQCQFSVPPPGDVHSSISQPPQHLHSLPPGLQLKQYYENTMFD